MIPNATEDGAPFGPGGPTSHGPTIPGLKILRRIGCGSYGEVWLAQDVTGACRAVKVVYRSRLPGDRPYQREFEGVQQFEPVSREHEGLVDVLQVGRDEERGFFFYVMELADDASVEAQLATEARPVGAGKEGPGKAADGLKAPKGPVRPDGYVPQTLRGLLRSGPDTAGASPGGRRALPARQCVEIGIELASALAFLHKRQLVHRDVKPSNIIFVNGQPKLADVGLVAAAGEAGTCVGTPGYIPPEGPGKPQADIYALGKVLYEMITGLDSKAGASPGIKGYPSLPYDWAQWPDYKELDEVRLIALRACEGNPDRRYKTADELHTDLVLLKSGKSLLLRRMQEAVRRARWTLAGLLMVVLLVASCLGLWFYRTRASEQARREKLREIQISRMRLRESGWFTNYWSRLGRAAAVRKDAEVLEQATALLAGLDARRVAVLPGISAASAAFGPDGRALISGVGSQPARLIDQQGRVTELPVRGEGAACWTVDGVPLVLLATTNRLNLREALTGKARREFPLPAANALAPGSDLSFDITPNASVVAAALGGRLLVWKADTGQLLGRADTVPSAVALSPDASLVALGGEDGTIRVYAVPGLALVAMLPPALRGNPIMCLAFTRDRVVRYGAGTQTNGWLLAAGDKGAGIVVWDLERRLPRSFCRGATWTVAALAFSPDGLTLASAGRNEPRLWDVTSGKALLDLNETSSGDSLALAFDDTGRRLICGGEAGAGQCRTALWELEPHRGILALRGLASAIRKVWFSADSRRVAALSDDWHVALWEASSGRLVFLLETPVGVLADNAAGAFDAEGARFAFATGQEACVYDLATSQVRQRWRLNHGLSDQLQFDRRGRLLLLRRERGSALRPSIWRLYQLGEAPGPVLLHEQPEMNSWAEELALAPGGERFLVWNGGAKGIPRVIRAYDVATGRELWRDATERTEGNSRILLDPTGKWFGYNARVSGAFRIMRFSDFQEIGTSLDGLQAISPSGDALSWPALSSGGRQPKVALTTDWELSPDAGAFGKEGKLLAWGTGQGVVLVINTQEVERRLASLGKRACR